MSQKLTAGEVEAILDDYVSRGGGIGVQFSGGEPTLNPDALLAGISYCASRGIPATLITNGWWGKKSQLFKHLYAFNEAGGLTLIRITHDKYHAKFNNWTDIKDILDIAPVCGIPALLAHITRADKDMAEIEAEFKAISNNELSVLYDRAIIGVTISGGRAQTIKSTWGQVPLVCPFMANWRQELPWVSVMPDHRVCINCIHNTSHTYVYAGSWTRFIDKWLEKFMDLQRKHFGLLADIDKKPHPFVDGCDVCEYLSQQPAGTSPKLIGGGV